MSVQDQKNSETEQKTVPVRTEEKKGRSTQNTGRVWLVGAGPGAPDLITKRGHDLLIKADVVVYDALILPETLEMIPDHTERIYVGKRAGAHSVPQEEIQRILIREARAGKRVVRLKGGDPFVFGRGGEEALALAKQGIPCEVVPGVTSAVAVPEAFGIPVTHRGMATSFTVITGHGQAVRENSHPENRSVHKETPAGVGRSETETTPAAAEVGPLRSEMSPGSAETYRIDYEALVRTGGTLIFLMGLGAAGSICRGLMDAGLAPSVPAAALSKGTTSNQRMVLSDVGRLPEEIRSAGLEAPAILVVGEVCALAPALYGSSSREKTTVVVTRQAEKAGAFAESIRAMGMNVYMLPAIRIQRPEENVRMGSVCALRKLCGEEKSAWIVFTSANGVQAFFDLLEDAGLDLRDLFDGGRKKFAVVGKKTAEELKKHGIRPDLVPETHTAASLGEALCQRTEGEEGAVWFFGAVKTDGGLKETFESHEILLISVPVYETVSAVSREDADRLAEQIDIGAQRFLFTFTSASCVQNLAAEMDLGGQTAVCIGKKTARAATEAGMRVVIAEDSTEESMLEAVRQAADLCV